MRGLAVTGLHWLLVAPTGLSITSPDAAVRARTVDVMRRLVDLCADLGGTVLVHGSPGSGRCRPGESRDTALARAQECFAAAAAQAAARRRRLLHRAARPRARPTLVNTVAEACGIVDAIDESRLAHDDRHQRGGPDRGRAGRRADRPLAADRPHRARAGQRPQPARSRRGRRSLRAGVRRTAARTATAASWRSSRSTTCPTARRARRARSAICAASSRRSDHGAERSGDGEGRERSAGASAAHPRRPASRPVPRDPERTRARILEAATRSSRATGSAARASTASPPRAGANKRMLYYYFRDKDRPVPRRARGAPTRTSAPPSAALDLEHLEPRRGARAAWSSSPGATSSSIRSS